MDALLRDAKQVTRLILLAMALFVVVFAARFFLGGRK
jgi:hypothetical protein